MKMDIPALKRTLGYNSLMCFTFAALTAACIYMMAIFPQVD